MNSQQLKYARERLNEIYREKQQKIGSSYSWGLSTEEKIKAYNEGNVGIDHDGQGNFKIVFEGEVERREELKLADEKLKKDYKNILDELVLGDTEVALHLINSFKEE